MMIDIGRDRSTCSLGEMGGHTTDRHTLEPTCRLTHVQDHTLLDSMCRLQTRVGSHTVGQHV